MRPNASCYVTLLCLTPDYPTRFQLPSIEHVTPSTDMRDLSSCSETPLLSWPTTSLWERLDAKTLTDDEQCRIQRELCSDTRHASVQYLNHQRDDRQTVTTKVYYELFLVCYAKIRVILRIN
jgi:hypothetical protein